MSYGESIVPGRVPAIPILALGAALTSCASPDPCCQDSARERQADRLVRSYDGTLVNPDVQNRIDAARRIFDARLPDYERRYKGLFVGVDSTGREYISKSLVEVERLAFEKNPDGGFFIGGIFYRPLQ